MDKKEGMDANQVKRSVAFHGVELLRRLGEEQHQGAPTAALLGLTPREHSSSPEIKSVEIYFYIGLFCLTKS